MFTFRRLTESIVNDRWCACLMRARVPVTSHKNAWSFEFSYTGDHPTEAAAQKDAEDQLAAFTTMMPPIVIGCRAVSAITTREYVGGWTGSAYSRGWHEGPST